MSLNEMIDESIKVTLLVIDALEKLGIRYFLAGSLASSLYGEPRATRDADILADLKPEHAELLPQMLEDEFYVSSESIRQALNRRGFTTVLYSRLMSLSHGISLTKTNSIEEHCIRYRKPLDKFIWHQ